ncbi:TfoX/Sxy family protein [Methyloceanibacter sp.]|jgi:DNA transformation protein|uniref:TfoX/Sxy family protein n=1 Tax=Methyloceanibacter sp. TaxID=1965321 RepID=UPI00356A805B
MPPSEGFKAFVADQLAGFGPVNIRNMFGGAGIYADGVMFAILADDTLYLKADETSSHAFADEGMEPFTYTAKGGKPIAMSYWEVPPRLLEEPDELAEWAREAHRIACAQKKPSRKSSKKRKSA